MTRIGCSPGRENPFPQAHQSRPCPLKKIKITDRPWNRCWCLVPYLFTTDPRKRKQIGLHWGGMSTLGRKGGIHLYDGWILRVIVSRVVLVMHPMRPSDEDPRMTHVRSYIGGILGHASSRSHCVTACLLRLFSAMLRVEHDAFHFCIPP